jgi:signal transduction histidine kinase
VESLAKTTEDVMAGDLTRRANVLGNGDEFDRLSERLNAMLTRLERLMIDSRHAGDAIAHDLRTPLARLRNNLEQSLVSVSNKSQFEETIADSIEDVDRVLDTFNAILRLSRVQGGQAGKFDKFSASELMEELAELYEPVCEEEGHAFEADIRPNTDVIADKSLITQVMANLLDNAVKYTPSQSGGQIKLELKRKRGGEVVFSVSDNGPGVPLSERKKVLERFFRLEKSRTEPGSGLGLSLVAAVAEMHQADLSLSDGLKNSQDSAGLKVSLSLAST